ncbi:MAG: chorismate pyruvate-lyase family protein [Bryobacteraceae bacterium]|jgi:chorismate-pyruvate lyase
MAFLAQLDGFDASSLDLLQRILLISDGTLTETLEAAFLEPIALIKLAIDTQPASARIDALEVEAGAMLMRRKILLCGETGGINFVYAESLLVLGRLPGPFREGLVESNLPIGRLWLEQKLETWKQILTVERRPAGDSAEYFELGEDAEILARRYRVFSGGQPVMMITEHFPANYGRPHSGHPTLS